MWKSWAWRISYRWRIGEVMIVIILNVTGVNPPVVAPFKLLLPRRGRRLHNAMGRSYPLGAPLHKPSSASCPTLYSPHDQPATNQQNTRRPIAFRWSEFLHGGAQARHVWQQGHQGRADAGLKDYSCKQSKEVPRFLCRTRPSVLQAEATAPYQGASNSVD
ncbi:hypothetical protein OH77DRAFT_1156049 [Trametes cingulata]|nr:hypothetical protein OH77DRAFT_1156049 [Trametes cingulata]